TPAEARGNVRAEQVRICRIEGGIMSELQERLGIGCKCAAQHRLGNEVDSELRGMRSCNTADIITELVFVLLTLERECGYPRHELVGPEGLKTRGRVKVGAERKCQRKTEVRIADFGVVKDRGLYDRVPDPF